MALTHVIITGIEEINTSVLTKRMQSSSNKEFLVVRGNDQDTLDIDKFFESCPLDKNWIMTCSITTSLCDMIIDLIDRSPDNAKPSIIVPWVPGPGAERGLLREVMAHALENGCDVRSGPISSLLASIIDI